MIVAFGWAAHNTGQLCAVDVQHPYWTLCGRRVNFLPRTVGGWDSDIPTNLHPDCRRRMTEAGAVPQVDDQRYGVCPGCGGDVPLRDDGRVDGHRVWVAGRHGPRPGGEPCAGEGELPEVEG